MHFKLILFYNPLTFSKAFNQGLWLAVLQWCHTYMCSTNSGSKPELTKRVDDQHHGTNKAGLQWFGCQLETNPVTLFIYHHGTGPSSESTPFCLSVVYFLLNHCAFLACFKTQFKVSAYRPRKIYLCGYSKNNVKVYILWCQIWNMFIFIRTIWLIRITQLALVFSEMFVIFPYTNICTWTFLVLKAVGW